MSVKRILTEEEIHFIIDSYSNTGLTITEIREKLHIKLNRIREVLIQNNIPIKKRGLIKNRTINEDYFKIIDTEGKAYFLGLLFADGSIYYDKTGNRSPSLSLELVECDVDILHRFQQELGANNNLYYNKRANRVNGTYCFKIRSKSLVNDLSQYGIVQNKTYIINQLPNLSLNYLIYFLRGYLDGDGSIYYSGGYWHINFTAYNKKLLENVRDILSSLIQKTQKLKISTSGTACHLTYNGTDAYKIIKLLYDKSFYHITRKYVLANCVLDEYKKVENIV